MLKIKDRADTPKDTFALEIVCILGDFDASEIKVVLGDQEYIEWYISNIKKIGEHVSKPPKYKDFYEEDWWLEFLDEIDHYWPSDVFGASYWTRDWKIFYYDSDGVKYNVEQE